MMHCRRASARGARSSLVVQALKGRALTIYGDGTQTSLLGWEPRVPLEEGLQRTIDYFRHLAEAAPADADAAQSETTSR